MKKVTVTPLTTLIAQAPAGMAIKAIKDEDGNLYLPVLNVEGSGEAATTTSDAAATKKGGKAAAKDDGGEEETTAPTKRGGKKAAEEEAPAKGKRGGAAKESNSDAPDEKTLTKFFKDLEGGKIAEDDAEDAIVELTGDKTAQKGLGKLVKEFMKDADLTVEEMVEKATALFEGGDDDGGEEEAPKAKRGGKEAPSKKAAKSKTEAIDDVKDLEVGDKVKMLLSTDDAPDGEEWEAEVTKSGRKVVFKFSDGEEMPYDEDSMTEIERFL